MVVKTVVQNGMVELKVETVKYGQPFVVAVLTCLDSPDARRAAVNLANSAAMMFLHSSHPENVTSSEVQRLGVVGNQVTHK